MSFDNWFSTKYQVCDYYILIRYNGTFECYIYHLKVGTFKGSFESRTLIYALLLTRFTYNSSLH